MVTQAAARIGPIIRQRTSARVCQTMGRAAMPSSSSTTGTVRRGPSSSANGGAITIAPPKPVMPRTTPAVAATAMAIQVSGAEKPTVYRDGFAGDERGGLRADEERELRHVVSAREPAQRYSREHARAQLGRQLAAHHVGLEHRGRDRVD